MHLLGRGRRRRWDLPAASSGAATEATPSTAALPFRHGRAIHELRSGHRYIDAARFPLPPDAAADPDLYAWFDPSQWRHWPDLAGRRVAIVANRALTGQGAAIDAHDEVIRLNRMPSWAHDAEHDGLRMTMWAGVAHPHVVPRFNERFYPVAAYPSCFPEIAGQLKTIWCVTPFHVSARFLNFLHEGLLLDRLVVSGSGTFYYDTMLSALPAEMSRLLYSVPVRENHPMPQLHFDLMLTGVRTALLCLLAGAAEIGLFGFDFYADGTRQPWEGHDVRIDQAVLEAMMRHARTLGCLIRRYDR